MITMEHTTRKWKIYIIKVEVDESCNCTWSIAEGCFPWWNVEMRTANAWTWFMLTLNWSCNIRARSSHMLVSVSFLLKAMSALRYKYNQMDRITPPKTKITRAFFLHFPPVREEIWACCCCNCGSGWSCWDSGCCWMNLFCWFSPPFAHNWSIFQLITIPRRTHQHSFVKQKAILSQCSGLRFPTSLICDAFWQKWTTENQCEQSR